MRSCKAERSCGVGLPAYKGEQSSPPEFGHFPRLTAIKVFQPTFSAVSYTARAEAKPEKVAPSELLKVELALGLAGWKPALLDGGLMRSCKADL